IRCHKKELYFCAALNPQAMLRLLGSLFVLTMVVTACDSPEKNKLKSEVDSLRNELEASQRVAKTLQDVGSLMDSIDANRQLLRINMVEGTTYDDYTARMKDLNKYVKDTEKKIADLENALKKSQGSAAAYAKQIKKLKSDLEAKTTEIIALQEQVEKYKNENQNLINLTELQSAEIADKEIQIATKEQELALIEARIQELMIQSKVS